MRVLRFFIAFIFCFSWVPAFAKAETYLHYTSLWHVTEREWPTLNNDMVLRNYVRNSSGYIVPHGYRIVQNRRNECVVAVPDALLSLVDGIWENAEPIQRYSGHNVYVKLKESGVTHFTITRQREIVNVRNESRLLVKADYDFLKDHLMSVTAVSACS